MARATHQVEKKLLRPLFVNETTFTCDKCGVETFEHKEPYNCEVKVGMNEDDCVSSLFRRDYCPECLGPKWAALCAILGADPETEVNEWGDE
jgi:hypothetical protein